MECLAARRLVYVSGLVQGVGFRPFVYRLARMIGLAGSVKNTADGVTIEVQGDPDLIDEFLDRLYKEAPPLAQIHHIALEELDCLDESDFLIDQSCKGDSVHTLVSPDVAVCEDCLREMFDPEDRRFHYPFINCTNCGPRLSIVRDIPYDRSATSMAHFRMCA